jgi:hypothetical protein
MPSEIEIYSDTVLFGIRITFESSDRNVLDEVRKLYSQRPRDEEADTTRDDSIYVVLKTYNVNEFVADSAHTDDTGLSIVRDGIFMQADCARRRGACIFPVERLGTDSVRDAIDTVLLFLVAHAGRIPVHASAVMFGDTAIVLAGRSGAGKSSLALAANRAGYPVLSDDTIFVQTVPNFCIWARPQAIHVAEKDAPAGVHSSARFRSGRWKRAIPIAVPRYRAERTRLCVLGRADEVSLEAMPEAEAVTALTREPEPGYEFYGKSATEAVRAIAAGGCWKLSLSRDANAAMSLLATTFAGGRR